MTLRTVLLPAALLLALSVAAAPAAEASPYRHGPGAEAGVLFGPRIHIGGRVSFPIGYRSRGHWETVVRTEGGYYVTRTEEVQVPGDLIGYDRHGRPIYSAPRVELRTHQVWVPRREVVERVWVPHRARGHVTIGGGIRLR